MFSAEQISAIMDLFLGGGFNCLPTKWTWPVHYSQTVLPNIEMEAKNVLIFCPHVFTVAIIRQANMAIEQFSQVTQQFINLYGRTS